VNLSLFVGSALHQGLGLGQRALAACAELLFPSGCAACESPLAVATDGLCIECRATLQPLPLDQICRRCALPLDEELTRLRLGSQVLSVCRHCANWPDGLLRLWAPFEYGGALAEAIIRCKWQARFDLIAPLSRLLLPSLQAAIVGCDAVVPVPLHGDRLRLRGYNQAARLAQAALAGLHPTLRRPLRPDWLLRLRPDPPARQATVAERQQRSHGAFAASPAARLRGLRLLLVDDVVTTGATLAACTQALRAAGAQSVVAVALARAVTASGQGP